MDRHTFALLCATDRARLNLTLAELGERVGVLALVVEAFEDGTVLPTPDVLLALAGELGWSEAETAPLLAETRRALGWIEQRRVSRSN